MTRVIIKTCLDPVKFLILFMLDTQRLGQCKAVSMCLRKGSTVTEFCEVATLASERSRRSQPIRGNSPFMASISVTELPPVLPRTSSSELALEFKVRMRKRTEPERSLLALNWDTTEMGTLNVIPVYRRFKSVQAPTRSQSLLDTTSTSTCPSLPSLYDRTTDPLLLISKTYVEANRTRTARLIPLLPSPTSLRLARSKSTVALREPLELCRLYLKMLYQSLRSSFRECGCSWSMRW